MHTGTSILIRASREAIFDAVSDLSRWPELLPHYRYVRTLGKEGGREIVRMAATRDGIPISWVSAYEADRAALELRFEHLRAWTKGMKVVWTLTATPEGTRVEIIHDMKFRVPALGWLVEPIIGGFFIENIAMKTLRTFKGLIEGTAMQPSNAES
ncbi:MAG: cyclase/dehydrase [Chthoniobacteraceae bacterium]|nr:cyclase/dehydrase [Chthoniobacteraceae bacterium]